jgi:hypothetical protein
LPGEIGGLLSHALPASARDSATTGSLFFAAAATYGSSDADVVLIPEHDHLRRRRVEHTLALDAKRLSARDTWSGACMAVDAAAERSLERTQ